jgi:hypothetical protein
MIKSSSLSLGLIVALTAVSAWAAPVAETTIEGKYLEVRSCDVFTAACFANSEVGQTGDEAIMAWDVTRGSFGDMPLDGLKVVAVVKAKDTLTDAQRLQATARAVIYVDERATPDQQEALVALAREMGGTLIDEIVRVESAPIAMTVNVTESTGHHHHGHANPGVATLTAGADVEVSTRQLTDHDKHCGNDEAFYPPLTTVKGAMPGFTEIDRFSGEGLDLRWSDSGRRSAYLASFAR